MDKNQDKREKKTERRYQKILRELKDFEKFLKHSKLEDLTVVDSLKTSLSPIWCFQIFK
jgi:hypothetical protein